MEKEQKHKNKGLLATIGYHAALILAFIFFGLSYQDPPPEDGIAINFGYEDDGFGNTSQSAQEQSAPQPEEVIEEQIENVATQDVVDAPSITEEKPKVKPADKPTEKPVVDTKPKPSNDLNRALNNTKGAKDVGTGSGEGVTQGGGDQGREDGSIDSQNRTGGGSGNGNYDLKGRSATSTPKPIYDCEEEGRVVVKVRVDRNGKTVSAEPGVNTETAKTNTAAPCLLRRAKEAALKTTWSAKQDATEQQTGFIIYNFIKR